MVNKPIEDIDIAKYEWSKKAFTVYPYSWEKEYLQHNHEVHFDSERNLNYVIHNGRKLYFKRNLPNGVDDLYNTLLIEQDIRSGHRYVENYDCLKGKNLLDIGCAEAIFTLDTIGYVNHAYLFECDEGWIEALEATFSPYKDKVTIIQKYVSEAADENEITIDSFVATQGIDNIFLKMDIEGFERKALKGAQNTFSSQQQIEGAVCIYHLPDDKKVIGDMLTQYKCKISTVKGFLYMDWGFTEGVMRFKK